MRNRHDDSDEESEALSSRREHPEIHHHYTQRKNGNGSSLNTIVWAAAAFGVLSLATITGVMWAKQMEMTAMLARLEAQMVIVLQRLPP